MSDVNIPEIRDIPEVVNRFIPEPVEVFRPHDGPEPGGFLVSSDQDTTHMVHEILEALGIPPDRNLQDLCLVMSRVAVKRLVGHRSLSLEFGPWGDPSEVIEVNLRPTEP